VQDGVDTLLTGWGRTSPTRSRLRVLDDAALTAAVGGLGDRGAIVRGLGRSYGDAAQNGGGEVWQLRAGGEPIRLHPDGTVTAHASVSVDELLRVLVPRGWFVPVTAGTRFITVGGAIACDVHGKNHHVDGSFGQHLRRMRLLTADGTVRELTPEDDPELWWATIGGMGLTGVILDATFSVLPVTTSRCRVDTLRAADLDEVLAAMDEGDHRYRYSVAWIDLLATGATLGRSVLTRGDHATVDELDVGDRRDPLAYDPSVLASVPPAVPNLLTPLTVRAFNEVWFRRAPRRRTGEIQTIAAFFHPLDMVGSWNRLYGRHGFVQYQFVVPFGQETALRRVVESIAGSGHASFLAVLKRFGPANPAPLSFPTEGWTLALDLPVVAGLGPLLHGLDELVLDAGGRHYLAKDAHTTPAAVRRGYPRLDEWRTVRERVDPKGRWASDLARRLGLLDPPGR
jgi:decaprenylphospho-beta-D-ribofuranose 2-oxidase